MSDKISPILDEALGTIERLRTRGTHVHSITNTVAQNFTANVLLACGASVSMTVNPDEIEAFTARAQSLHINLGTLDAGREAAIRRAVAQAARSQIPVLLDPVMVHVSPLRLALAKKLLPSVAIVKANREEVLALGEVPNEVCSVQTGETDRVAVHGNQFEVANGTPMLASTIATGCALGALISALSACTPKPEVASLAGLIWFSVSGEIAAQKARGPGGFPAEFLDVLNSVSIETLGEKARLA